MKKILKLTIFLMALFGFSQASAIEFIYSNSNNNDDTPYIANTETPGNGTKLADISAYKSYVFDDTNENIYFQNNNTSNAYLKKYNIASGEITNYTNIISYDYFDISNGYLYYFRGGNLRKLNLETLVEEVIYSTNENIGSIQIIGNYLYGYESGGVGFFRININGGDFQSLFYSENAQTNATFFVNNTGINIYYITNQHIYKYNVSSGTSELINNTYQYYEMTSNNDGTLIAQDYNTGYLYLINGPGNEIQLTSVLSRKPDFKNEIQTISNQINFESNTAKKNINDFKLTCSSLSDINSNQINGFSLSNDLKINGYDLPFNENFCFYDLIDFSYYDYKLFDGFCGNGGKPYIYFADYGYNINITQRQDIQAVGCFDVVNDVLYNYTGLSFYQTGNNRYHLASYNNLSGEIDDYILNINYSLGLENPLSGVMNFDFNEFSFFTIYKKEVNSYFDFNANINIFRTDALFGSVSTSKENISSDFTINLGKLKTAEACDVIFENGSFKYINNNNEISLKPSFDISNEPWSLTIFGVDVGNFIYHIINGTQKILLSIIFVVIDWVNNNVLTFLTAGLGTPESGNYYCYFGQEFYYGGKIQEYYSYHKQQYVNTDNNAIEFLLLGLLSGFILITLFKKW